MYLKSPRRRREPKNVKKIALKHILVHLTSTRLKRDNLKQNALKHVQEYLKSPRRWRETNHIKNIALEHTLVYLKSPRRGREKQSLINLH